MTSSVRWMRITASLLVILLSLAFLPNVHAQPPPPNDTLLDSQWGWWDIYADRAYNTSFHGQGITVAVLDTGVDPDHSDLAANLNLAEAWNFVDNNNNVTDEDGHGTMTTGIIAALANNSLGVAGAAPEVTILPLKVLTREGGTFISVDAAITYAVQHGARVISMSFGGQPGLLGLPTELAIDYAYSSGVVLVAAAGNNGANQTFYPAAYSQVIAVSAVTPSNLKSDYSNYGSYIDLAAPGDNIRSTYLNGGYAFGSGTSFAAPFVAAVAALLLSRNSSMTPGEVNGTLDQEAIDLGVPGYDQYYGYGLVSACAAVTSGCPSTPGWTQGNNIPSPSLGLPSIILATGFSVAVACWRVRRLIRG